MGSAVLRTASLRLLMPSTLEEIAAESGIPKPIHAAVARLAIEAVHETPNTTSTDNKSTPKAPTVVSVSE